MQLDLPTLMIAGAFVAACSAVLLLFAWSQYRETSAALWWAGADTATASAVVMLIVSFAVDHRPLFLMALTLLQVASAMVWAGARAFDHHRINVLLFLGGMLPWPVAALMPGFVETVWSPALHAGVTLFYYGSAALSIKRGNGERLQARTPLSALLILHAGTLLLMVPSFLNGSLAANEPPPLGSLFGIIHFESLVFSIGTALFLVALMKERSEGRYASASLTDPLTGLLNRRGFLKEADRLLQRSRSDSKPTAVVVLDLDRFKAINDDFGHELGDRVLQVFADSCRSVLRQNDVIGRIGGEEFAIVLADFGVDAGWAMAERVRKAFAHAAAAVDAIPVGATLSGGVSAGIGVVELQELLKQADSSLYRAKSRGRNRVERYEVAADVDAAEKIVHIA